MGVARNNQAIVSSTGDNNGVIGGSSSLGERSRHNSSVKRERKGEDREAVHDFREEIEGRR